MNKRLFSAAAFLLPLAMMGCNPSVSVNVNSGDDDVEVSTGTFLELNITGLPYTTETMSGSLENGSYEFLDGESVTVSLFGKTLAEFDGADGFELNDFTTDFPLTEDDFASAFFEGEGYSDFIEFANILQLLAMLDADENLENGIDVSAYNAISSVTTELDFTLAPADFFDQTLIQLANEIESNRNITPVISMAYLYSIDEQEMPYIASSTSVYDDDNDGSVDSTTEYTYSDAGYLTYETSLDELGVIESNYVFEHDEFSRMVSERYPNYDSEGNVTFERGTQYTYNNLGQLIAMLEYFGLNSDGEYNSSSEYTYQYDSQGLQTVYTQLSGSNYTHRSYVYNDDRTLASYTETRDSDNDGEAEFIHYYSYTYNEAGMEIEDRQETDEDADGSIDETKVVTTEYNADGNETLITDYRYDSEEVLSFSFIQSYSYDENGYEIGYEYTQDFQGDGDDDYRYTIVNTLDENGEIETRVSNTYEDGETLSQVRRVTYDNPELGWLSSETTYTDNDGNGTEDEWYRWEITVNELGQRETSFYQKDEDNDGIVDSEKLRTYTYETFQDGVGGYLFKYYAFWNW